jgi:hypothetical protein
MIAYMALLAAILACIAATWSAYMIQKLPDRLMSKLDSHIIEVVDEPVTRDGDHWSTPASPSGEMVTRHSLPSDGLTHAQREERVLRRGVPGWPGARVHGA